MERMKTTEDDRLVKDYLLSVIMLETLEYDIKQVKSSKVKMNSVYVRLLLQPLPENPLPLGMGSVK